MSQIKLTIDSNEVMVYPNTTILQAAKTVGVAIPSLCFDDRITPYAACGICVCEVEGSTKLLRACSTLVRDGMQVITRSAKIDAARKSTLELMLSDHTGDCLAPCQMECPANTNCQGYTKLIAEGEYQKAVELIRENLPLPASIGRICPHPCESACRRGLVEEPISLASLKVFAAQYDTQCHTAGESSAELPVAAGESSAELPATTGKSSVELPAATKETSNIVLCPTVEKKPSSDRCVAIIGGGPAGLTAAYFLRQYGHKVTIYENMPKMGGMLQYGIPEYRLPKKVLDAEIKAIERMGVTFKNNIKVGSQITLDALRQKYHAVVLASGAWKALPLNCKGEDLDGVIQGTDFLRDVASSQNIPNTSWTKRVKDKVVAVVGGGNVAMDVCRTAVRLGTKSVYVIYRRTRDEMPAAEIEIKEGEQEGVTFKYLTNPIEIIDTATDPALKLVLQKMKLGAPDANGRPTPIAIEGKQELLDVDLCFIAVGSKFDSNGFLDIALTKRQTVMADQNTFQTSLGGVFSVGDATNNGADIAIAAIGEARRAAKVIDSYLNGNQIPYHEPILVKDTKTQDDFIDNQRQRRINTKHISPNERIKSFQEVNLVYSKDDAINEAKRCLRCGCHDYGDCKLIDYTNQYRASPTLYEGQKNKSEYDNFHPKIRRNQNKCILCGLCVNICQDVAKVGALGLAGRGFNTKITFALDKPIQESPCFSCTECAKNCPTGALEFKGVTL